jgi:hypothetical protein
MKQMVVQIGGRQFEIAQVKMYHAKAIAHWRALIVGGSEKMQHVSTGLGLIGSPAWVIGGGVALGLLEASLTSKANKEGAALLAQAGQLLDEMRSRAKFFDVDYISGNNLPTPESWSASDGAIQFAVLGGEFLDIMTHDQTELAIRWSAVDCFAVE